MKKILALLIINIFALTAFSQVELYGRYTQGGKVEPDINFYGEKKISKKINLTYFALIEEKWSEALIGLSYSPVDWFSTGLSAGIEHNPAILRVAGSLWFGKGKNSFLTLWEKGKGSDNYWYKITLSRKFSESFSLAARGWRYHGIGPVATLTSPKIGLSYWVMPAYDFEYKAKRLIFGISYKL